MRSDIMKQGLEKYPHRSLLKAMGLTDKEIDQPIIGVANSFNEFIPGHIHLDKITQAAKAGVRMNGGTPLEFGVIGVCDGLAMNHAGMKYSLPSRELIAEQIPLGARIVAVANTLDSITSDLPYRPKQSHEAAREEIIRWSGRQFDPDVVKAFLEIPEDIWGRLRRDISSQAQRH